jgi:hypothetical protein
MTQKGEYRLEYTPFQSVVSHPRRHGVMFNPSSSRSRLRIVDSGRRYELRLTDDGAVQYSLDGITWRPILPLHDPCTGEIPPPVPAFVSFDVKRSGEPINPPPRFDMIAVGRGRVLAKESGTDRLFHLVMDELHRTHTVTGHGCNLSVECTDRTEDPPVPGFYMKLDPEFFTRDEAPPLPPEAERNYAEHPGSLRLPVYAELLRQNALDMMPAFQRPRVWYLIDARSPLMIVGPEDLRFNEDDLNIVFTKERILEILKTAKGTADETFKNALWYRRYYS